MQSLKLVRAQEKVNENSGFDRLSHQTDKLSDWAMLF